VTEADSGIESTTFATEVEQYAYDQSLTNSENTGMVAAVIANLILLVVIVAIIYFVAKRKSSR
jgi:hypothetical protein